MTALHSWACLTCPTGGVETAPTLLQAIEKSVRASLHHAEQMHPNGSGIDYAAGGFATTGATR